MLLTWDWRQYYQLSTIKITIELSTYKYVIESHCMEVTSDKTMSCQGVSI